MQQHNNKSLSDVDFASSENRSDTLISLASVSQHDKDNERDRKEVKVEASSHQNTNKDKSLKNDSVAVVNEVKIIPSLPISIKSAQTIVQEKVEGWGEQYYEAALKCINLSIKNGELQKEHIQRLKILLGPERYWTQFQVKQKIYHLDWLRIKAQSEHKIWQLMIAQITEYLKPLNGVRKLIKVQVIELIKIFEVALQKWRYEARCDYEQVYLKEKALELNTRGYDTKLVNLNYHKVLVRHYRKFLKTIQNEALLYGNAIKDFRNSGNVEAFIHAITEYLNKAKKTLTTVENEIAKHKELISNTSMSKIISDYESDAVAWIEKDIKDNPSNKTICYYNLAAKQFVKNIVQSLDSTVYANIEVRLSQFIDRNGNTLLHHALNMYHNLPTESAKEVFIEVIEILYRHGALAHVNNFRAQNAYEYAGIDKSEWRTFTGWRIGFLEMEAAFTYSQMQESVRTILCQYSKSAQVCLKGGFFGWIVGLFQDFHSLKATVRSRDLNEVLQEVLFAALNKLNDEVLEKAIIHQRAVTLRGDRSELFERLINEVIIPLSESKLFALKTDLPSMLEFYKEELEATQIEIEQLKKREQILQTDLKDMRENFSQMVRNEVKTVLVSIGLIAPSIDEKEGADFESIGSPLLSFSGLKNPDPSSSTSSITSGSASVVPWDFFSRSPESSSNSTSPKIPIQQEKI